MGGQFFGKRDRIKGNGKKTDLATLLFTCFVFAFTEK
jgi:hypothetical protein